MGVTKDEALRMALECIEAWDRGANASDYWRDRFDAITAIRKVLAIEANEQPALDEDQTHYKKVIDDVQALFEAKREQPAPATELRKPQEPVAWEDEQGNVRMTLDAGEIQSSVGYVYSVHGERIKNACIRSDIPNGTPLYTSSPAPKPWVGLTNQELIDLTAIYSGAPLYCAIEAKLREKNA